MDVTIHSRYWFGPSNDVPNLWFFLCRSNIHIHMKWICLRVESKRPFFSLLCYYIIGYSFSLPAIPHKVFDNILANNFRVYWLTEKLASGDLTKERTKIGRHQEILHCPLQECQKVWYVYWQINWKRTQEIYYDTSNLLWFLRYLRCCLAVQHLQNKIMTVLNYLH